MTTNKVLIGCTLALIATMGVSTAFVLGAIQNMQSASARTMNLIDQHTSWVRQEIEENSKAAQDTLDSIDLHLQNGIEVEIVR